MMKHIEILAPIFIGFLIGVTLSLVLIKYSDSIVSRHYKMIEECEKSLPRDQHCKVIAVPASTLENDKH